jgi:large subunit ribosomal protein L30
MPEKKAQTEKVKATVAEKPVVKKTAVKTTTAAAKPKVVSTKTAATKAPAAKAVVAKAKAPVAAKPEIVEVKTTKVIEEPRVAVEVTKPAAKPEPKKVLKGKVLKITLIKSGIGYSKRHKKTLKALGFRHLHQTIEQPDSPSIRGMLALVNHLVRIEEQGTK